MRWLFLIVLSLNLAYMAWQTARPVMQSYESVQPLKNIRPIVLLSELKQQAHVVATAETSLLSNDTASKQQPELARPEVNSEKQRPPPTQIVAEVEAKEEAKEEIASINESEDIKRPALASDEAKLVAEVESIKIPDELQEKPLPKDSCFTLGPFRDLDKLRGFTREIKPYVVSTDFRGREEREQYLYWVYIKPEKNRKKAVETGKRLKAKKIKDFYVIREGEKIHGVSLGRFRNKSSAYGLTEKVKKLGFNVIVEPVFKTYTVYWLDYQLADGVSIPETLFEQYTQSTKKGKISRLSRSCDG